MKKGSYNDIAEAIYKNMEGKSAQEMTGALGNTVRFLYKRGLLGSSEEILAKVEKLINDKEGKVSAEVLSALPLSPAEKKQLGDVLKDRYKANSAELKEIIDKSLLGGFKIETEGEIIDNSIKGKLKKLKEQLTK